MNEIIKKVQEKWKDVYGFITLNPAAGSNPLELRYDSENQIHFTSIYYKLLELIGGLTNEDTWNINRSLSFISVKDNGTTIPGLFARHPDPYRTSNQHHGISHDEMNGLVILMGIITSKIELNNVVNYGKRHHWTYIDESPYSHPFQSFQNFKKYAGRIRQPRDRAFYRHMAGDDMGFLGSLHLIVTAIGTAMSPKQSTSGKILAFMRFMSFPEGHWFRKLPYRVFSSIMKKKYGEFYMEGVFGIYFRADHPFHEMIKLCRGKY